MSLNPYNADEAFARFNRRCEFVIGVLSVIAAFAFFALVILFCLWRTV